MRWRDCDDVILDGEIVAWEDEGSGGRARPFSVLQQRLGRKKVSEKMLREIPVAYLVFRRAVCRRGVAD